MANLSKAAVIGGGIMGRGIAALLANNKIETTIYDVSLDLAQKGIDLLLDEKQKPPLLYTPKNGKYLRASAISELSSLGQADLIVEAVPEILQLKQETWAKLDAARKPGSIAATNTSGISLASIAAGRSADLRKNFLGAHFFNPVRYLPLVELIPTSETDPKAVEAMRALLWGYGKEPVIGKDTPNFIANRVGIYMMMKVVALMDKYGFDVETIDMLTGTPIGNPKTATFRLADLVGIDTLVHAARNCLDNCTADPRKAMFAIPSFVTRMVEQKLHGDKTGCGFYKKEKKADGGSDILILDLKDFTYKPSKKPRSEVVKAAKAYSLAEDRIRALLTFHKDAPESRFAAELLFDSASYALSLVGEIADDITTIDNALKWGFAKEVGPIEFLDIFGLQRSARWMEDLQIPVPEFMTAAMAKTDRLFDKKGGATAYFDQRSKDFTAVPAADPFAAKAPFRQNLSAGLTDLGDQVLLLTLDSAMVPGMNPVDDYLLGMMERAWNLLEAGTYKALVVNGAGANFCAGAQLQMVSELAKEKRWAILEAITGGFQSANLAFYHAPFPVIMAPHGMALGGGMEITLAGQKRVAFAEFYGGLVEVGVGLVPAGGGCLRLLEQFMYTMSQGGKKQPGPMPPIQAAFDLIGYGKVSSSADDAVDKGLLTREDIVVRRKDQLLATAKTAALGMLEGFKPIAKPELFLPGDAGYLVFADAIDGLVKTRTITEHAGVIARHQVRILTGGTKASLGTPVTEDDILELERQSFLSLCGEKKTQERIAYMLKNGKPLFN